MFVQTIHSNKCVCVNYYNQQQNILNANSTYPWKHYLGVMYMGTFARCPRKWSIELQMYLNKIDLKFWLSIPLEIIQHNKFNTDIHQSTIMLKDFCLTILVNNTLRNHSHSREKMSFEIWHLCVSTFNYFSETFLYKDFYDTSFTFLLKGAELLILLSIMRKHPIYSIMYSFC